MQVLRGSLRISEIVLLIDLFSLVDLSVYLSEDYGCSFSLREFSCLFCTVQHSRF